MEHRWGERLEFVQPVQVVHRGVRLPARLLNTSVSGALIECDRRPALYTNLVVVLPAAPGSDRDPAELVATVVRHADEGFAVEWRDMAAPPIVAFLARHSGHDLETLCKDGVFGG